MRQASLMERNQVPGLLASNFLKQRINKTPIVRPLHHNPTENNYKLLAGLNSVKCPTSWTHAIKWGYKSHLLWN